MLNFQGFVMLLVKRFPFNLDLSIYLRNKLFRSLTLYVFSQRFKQRFQYIEKTWSSWGISVVWASTESWIWRLGVFVPMNSVTSVSSYILSLFLSLLGGSSLISFLISSASWDVFFAASLVSRSIGGVFVVGPLLSAILRSLRLECPFGSSPLSVCLCIIGSLPSAILRLDGPSGSFSGCYFASGAQGRSFLGLKQ